MLILSFENDQFQSKYKLLYMCRNVINSIIILSYLQCGRNWYKMGGKVHTTSALHSSAVL